MSHKKNQNISSSTNNEIISELLERSNIGKKNGKITKKNNNNRFYSMNLKITRSNNDDGDDDIYQPPACTKPNQTKPNRIRLDFSSFSFSSSLMNGVQRTRNHTTIYIYDVRIYITMVTHNMVNFVKRIHTQTKTSLFFFHCLSIYITHTHTRIKKK